MHPFYSGLTDSVPCGPRFRWMWSIVPFDVGRDSIPCGPRFRQAVHDSGDDQNADRFPWNQRTTSPGITGPHRPEYASEMGKIFRSMSFNRRKLGDRGVTEQCPIGDRVNSSETYP